MWTERVSPAPTTSVRAISFRSRSFLSPSFQSISFRTTPYFKQPHSTQPHIPNDYVSRDFIPNGLIYNKRLQSKTNSYSRKTIPKRPLTGKKEKSFSPNDLPPYNDPLYKKPSSPTTSPLKRPPPKASHAAPIPPPRAKQTGGQRSGRQRPRSPMGVLWGSLNRKSHWDSSTCNDVQELVVVPSYSPLLVPKLRGLLQNSISDRH